MELMEQRKLQEFERRKALERERKKNRVLAHRKICSRGIAKGFLANMKSSAEQYLKDVGYFTNTFEVDVLEQNVMPWLFNKVEGFVEELDDLGNFPDLFLGANVDDFLKDHVNTVQAERDRKEAVKQAIEEAIREKQEEKRRRKEAKEQARKAAELKKLREDVAAAFVAKGEFKENILAHEMYEVSGNYARANTIGVLGGFLGQLALVVSGAHRRAKREGIASVLDAKNVQNFLHTYIDNKMKTDKFTHTVGKPFQLFLNTLEKPMALNEMRVMKEANYTRLRQILSDLSLYGDEFLALMREQNKHLGLSKKAYDLVYEGFWDLYCKKPANTADIPVKKLEGFIQRVKLVVPPEDVTNEDGSITPAPQTLPLKALVRIRIPLVRPTLDTDRSGAQDDEGDTTQREAKSNMDTSRSQAPGDHVQLSTHPDEDQTGFQEQQIDDKVFLVNPISDTGRVWLMH